MKTALIKTLVCFCSVAGVSLIACGGCNRDRDRTYDRERPTSQREVSPNEQDKSGTTTITGASWVANEAAIDRIALSRCAREMTCSNVGPDKHFQTGDACAVEVKKRTRDDLKASECPGGIDAVSLDKCLDSIRNESCSNPIDTLSRLANCRSGELCVKSEMPHR